MDVRQVLIELYDRIPGHVHDAVAGLGTDELATVPEPGSNPIGWLVWHLTRVQDDHVAELLDEAQAWTTGDWAARFGLAPDPHNTGFGHSDDQVAAVRPDSDGALIDYHRVVSDRTRAYLEGLSPGDLDRVIDDRWDPPVTVGVRLVSVADDDIQHAGQARYLRGVLARRGLT